MIEYDRLITMNGQIAKNENGSILNSVKEFLYSRYFPFMTAVISLLCYYLGWDIVFIYYIGIFGLIILLTLDDISPMATLLLFMQILVSKQNSPNHDSGHSDYYFDPAIITQIFIVIGLLALALIYRLVFTCKKRQFSLSPVFFGLCAFAFVLLFNGVFSAGYNPKNILYGLVMALCFLGIFVAFKDSLAMNEATFERIALSFFALSLALTFELFVAYLTTDGLYVDGNFNRGKLTFGWGVYNTMGMMLLTCLPAVFYLSGKYKYGFVFTLFSAILLVAIWMSCSRQAMLASAVIYPLCLIVLIFKGNNRLANLLIVICALAAIAAVLIIFKDTVFEYIKGLISSIAVNGKLSGSGRTDLWKGGIKYFESSPLFGVGFYSNLYNDFLGGTTTSSGMSFIPQMCHNTVIELMSACGICGLLAYFAHRVQTIVCLFRNFNYNRLFIALTVFSLLTVSLVDNHIFNIFPTIIYSFLIAALVASERKDKSLITYSF